MILQFLDLLIEGGDLLSQLLILPHLRVYIESGCVTDEGCHAGVGESL
jgi:hypothetical protein